MSTTTLPQPTEENKDVLDILLWEFFLREKEEETK